MLEFIRAVAKRNRDDRGASAVEYGLLVAAIAAIIVIIIFSLGKIVKEAFKDTCDGIKSGTTTISNSCTE